MVVDYWNDAGHVFRWLDTTMRATAARRCRSIDGRARLKNSSKGPFRRRSLSMTAH
jgi:hypothetical protein